MLKVISRIIWAMLSKLYTKTVVGTLMQTGNESFHNFLGFKLKRG
jgi:hypothetical protein